MTFKLTHARHDRAHCLAPGLFRSLKRGERKTSKLDVTYTFGNESIRFWGPEPLGSDDMRVLQGLVAMSGPEGVILKAEPDTEAGKQLRLALFDVKEIEDAGKNALVVQGSYRELAKEIGYSVDSGGAFNVIRASVERLWAVSIIVQSGKRRQGFRLLSGYASDEGTGHLFVAINPRIAAAVIGDTEHTRINMNEVRALQTDPARLIHQRLSGWIDPGKSGRVELDTICGYVWPDDVATPSTTRQRRVTARKSLAELSTAGWTVDEYAKNKFEISRPLP